jgi:hypothetical protein
MKKNISKKNALSKDVLAERLAAKLGLQILTNNLAKAVYLSTPGSKGAMGSKAAAVSAVISPAIMGKITWLAEQTEAAIVSRAIDGLLNQYIDDAGELIALVDDDEASSPKAAEEIAERLNGIAKARGDRERLSVDGCTFHRFTSKQPA